MKCDGHTIAKLDISDVFIVVVLLSKMFLIVGRESDNGAVTYSLYLAVILSAATISYNSFIHGQIFY